ncbi:MAG: hypothetical protein GF375_06530 [Candidatus Omnitrophica bacterium]|nr:hypothetical protein [Candidatus Omnitrophota bacterium]MBD3269630.1 hypothetical protein [Candidatus Omnitrophota bacterium]
MLAKKFALGFGIAVIFPLLIHYGVSTFSPPPEWEDYYDSDYYRIYKEAGEEEKKELEQKRKEQTEDYNRARKRFQKHLFAAAVPLGLVAIITGSLTGVPAIGTGLMFGGIFSLIDGYALYWSELQHWMRFVSLLVAFCVLIFIGYKKLAR